MRNIVLPSEQPSDIKLGVMVGSADEAKNNSSWENVFKKGLCYVGGGFLVGCGISVLTSRSNSSVTFPILSWPVLFSTGIGIGLAFVNIENELWNKKQESYTFENPAGGKGKYMNYDDDEDFPLLVD